MSITAIKYVIDHSKTKGSARVLMIVLADMANDDGECWPGKANLGKKVNCHPRHVVRLVNECEALGELRVIQSSTEGKPNQYLLTGIAAAKRVIIARRAKQLDKRKFPAPHDTGVTGDTDVTPLVASVSPLPMTSVSPKPKVKPKENPKNVAAKSAATADETPKPKRKPKQAPKPRSECEHEPVYEAVERFLFEITDSTPDDPYLWDSPQGFVTRWLLGRIAKFKNAELGYIKRAAEAHHVETFVRWFREQYKDAALPTGLVKFVTQWRKFGAAMAKKATPNIVHIDATPDPVITDADRAANLELMRANRPDFVAPKGKVSA